MAELTAHGREIVQQVTAHRRREIAGIVDWPQWGHHFLSHQGVVTQRPHRPMRGRQRVVVADGGVESHQTSFGCKERVALLDPVVVSTAVRFKPSIMTARNSMYKKQCMHAKPR